MIPSPGAAAAAAAAAAAYVPASVSSIINRKNKVLAASAVAALTMEDATAIEQKLIEDAARNEELKLREALDALMRKHEDLLVKLANMDPIAQSDAKAQLATYALQIETTSASLDRLRTKKYLDDFFVLQMAYQSTYEHVKRRTDMIAKSVAEMMHIRNDVLIVENFTSASALLLPPGEELDVTYVVAPAAAAAAAVPGPPPAKKRKTTAAAAKQEQQPPGGGPKVEDVPVGKTKSGKDIYTHKQRTELYFAKLNKITDAMSNIILSAIVEDFRTACQKRTSLGPVECVKYAFMNFIQLHKQFDSGLFQLSAAAATRASILEPSSMSVAMHTTASVTEGIEMCNVCGVPLMLVSTHSTLVCVKCGRSEIFLDCMNVITIFEKEGESGTQYKRIGHLDIHVTCMQAKDTKVIPQEVLVKILYVLTQAGKLVLSDEDKCAAAAELLCDRVHSQIDRNDIRYALKVLNLRRYYDNAPRILMMLTGRAPPQMTPAQEDRIRQRFRAIQPPFEKYCPPHRSNFLPYFYIIYKFCEIERWTEFLAHCKLPKKLEKRQQADRIWKLFCDELIEKEVTMMWCFYRTPPPPPPLPTLEYLLKK